MEEPLSGIAALTQRQKEILRLIARHLQAKEVARLLNTRSRPIPRKRASAWTIFIAAFQLNAVASHFAGALAYGTWDYTRRQKLSA